MKKIYSFICLSLLMLLALNVSARNIYVNQTAGDNLTGVVGDATKPYKDLSYVLYKINVGGNDNVATWLQTMTFGQVATNGDNIYIIGNYNLTEDMAYYNPADRGDSDNNKQGLWFKGEYVANGNDIYNIIGDGSTVISCADADWIAANPDVIGGFGRAIVGQGGFGLKFQNIRFEHCGWASGSSGDRGIIWTEHNAIGLTFQDCTFTKNKSNETGGNSGLMMLNNTTVNVLNCTFTGNQVAHGLFRYDGGGNYYKESPARKVVVDGCTFEDNDNAQLGTGDGGAIRLGQCWDVTISNTTIRNNTANYQGGAFFIEKVNHNLVLDNVTIDGNYAKGDNGGAIVMKDNTRTDQIGDGDADQVATDGLISIKNSFITNNQVGQNGGGIAITGNNVTNLVVAVENTLISGNTAINGRGGGLFVENTAVNLSLKNCQILNNTSKNGGGFTIDGNNTSLARTVDVKVDNCLFAGNKSDNAGAILYTNNQNVPTAITANVDITNSIFYKNATTAGANGAILLENGNNPASVFKMTDCIIKDNTASAAGGGTGLRINNGSLSLQKTISGCIFEGNNSGGTISDLHAQQAGTELSLENSYFSVLPTNVADLSASNIKTETNLLPTGSAADFYLENLGKLPLLPGTEIETNMDIEPAIVFTSNPSATVEQGNSFTVTAVGVLDALVAPDKEVVAAAATITPIIYDLIGEPAGVTIDPATGELSVGEDIPEEGDYIFVVTATDAAETTYEQEFELKVIPATITGLDNAVADKVPVSVSYFDLTGKPVPAGTKGFVVKRTVYEDGSISNTKAIVK